MFFLIFVLWVLCGFYGTFANVERVSRIYGHVDGCEYSDTVQTLATFFLGPVGIFLVMITGGRFKFWNEEL
jgi:hypothetical protein